MAGKKEKGGIVIRREEVVEGGHHGGAWKVAYADFVTAMMAFFLLMWVLNATTLEQRQGLADYFSPNNVMSRSTSGFGMPFGGRTPNLDGSMVSDRGSPEVFRSRPSPLIDQDENEGDTPSMGRPQTKDGMDLPAAARPENEPNPATVSSRQAVRAGNSALERTAAERAAADGTAETASLGTRERAAKEQSAAELRAELERKERAEFERAAQQIRDAVRADPALAELARQLLVEVTPEGLRIQIVDEERQPMFATGSTVLSDRARALLSKAVPVLLRLPEPVSIAGHTDAAPYRGGDRTNWDLSADRANAVRRLLADSGMPEARITGVAGHASREPLVAADPLAAANRRVAILLHRTAGR